MILKIYLANTIMRNSLILLVLIPLFSFGQINQVDSKGLMHGDWEGYYENSTAVKWKGKFEHGWRMGKFVFYHKSGKVKAIMMFTKVNGKSHSRAELYYDDGSLIAKGNYINREKDSVWTYYSGKGYVQKIETWKNGKKNGKTVIYYPPQPGQTELQALQVVHFKDSLPHGEVMEFYLSGKLKMKGNNVDGNFDGVVTRYFENGKKMVVERYAAAVRHGLWLFFDDKGAVTNRKYFKYGRELKGEELKKKLEEIKNNG